VLLKNDNLEHLSDSAAKELIEPLTKLLHSLAEKSGWPEEIIVNLSVEINENFELFVNYPDSMRQEIEDLEYGAFQGLPNAVIRPFIYRAPSIIKQTLESQIIPELFYSLGVM